MSKKIILYTIENCGNCKIAKKILEQYNLPFIEKRVDEDEKIASELEEAINGQKYLPTLVFNNSVYINIKPHEILELAKILKSK